MGAAYVNGDLDFGAVHAEGVEHGSVGRRNLLGAITTLDCSGQRRRVGGSTRLRSPVRQLPQLAQQQDRTAGDEHDHDI